jgi:hypothetical protein
MLVANFLQVCVKFFSVTLNKSIIPSCLPYLASNDRLLANRILDLVNIITQNNFHVMLCEPNSSISGLEQVELSSMILSRPMVIHF